MFHLLDVFSRRTRLQRRMPPKEITGKANPRQPCRGFLLDEFVFTVKKGDEEMRKITAHIDGMQCGMCESHVNDLVRKNFKVKKVKSSHRTGECTIIAECDIPRPELEKKLGEMGYRLLDMESEEYQKKGLFR